MYSEKAWVTFKIAFFAFATSSSSVTFVAYASICNSLIPSSPSGLITHCTFGFTEICTAFLEGLKVKKYISNPSFAK